jgi:hypothetical protein
LIAAVFGGALRADAPLPGLPVVHANDGFSVFATLSTRHALPDLPGGLSLGAHTYGSGITLALNAVDAISGPWRLAISDTGVFEISSSGAQIVHAAPRDVDRAAVTLDLIGAVLPIAFFRMGRWCVHASAVATPAGAVLFVAERGVGKSTLAAACAQAGAPLMADDVVVLERRHGAVLAIPSGVPLRLREASARAVAPEAGNAATDGWGKVRLTVPTQTAPLTVAAVYVLAPSVGDGVVSRTAVGATAAALALVAHGKVTPLLGGPVAPEAFLRATSFAADMPTYTLSVPRDLTRVAEVAAQVRAWHAVPAPATVPA